jgi:hypothetical protein
LAHVAVCDLVHGHHFVITIFQFQAEPLQWVFLGRAGTRSPFGGFCHESRVTCPNNDQAEQQAKNDADSPPARTQERSHRDHLPAQFRAVIWIP